MINCLLFSLYRTLGPWSHSQLISMLLWPKSVSIFTKNSSIVEKLATISKLVPSKNPGYGHVGNLIRNMYKQQQRMFKIFYTDVSFSLNAARYFAISKPFLLSALQKVVLK